MMVEEGHTNRLRMANRAISEHQDDSVNLNNPRKGCRAFHLGGFGSP